jgi:hypothetical protein
MHNINNLKSISQKNIYNLLYQLKGSQVKLKDSQWKIYSYKKYWDFSKKFGLSSLFFILIFFLIRRRGNIKIRQYEKTIILDCKGEIESSLLKYNILNDPKKLKFITLRYNIIYSIIEFSKTLIKIYNPDITRTAEDYNLLFEYAFHLSIYKTALNLSDYKNIIVAKDISPINAPLLELSMKCKIDLYLYSIHGQGCEEILCENHFLFKNIFISSIDELNYYKKLNRQVLFSLTDPINNINRLNLNIELVIGIILGSVATYVSKDEFTIKLKNCISSIMCSYPSLKKIIIRPHPNDFKLLNKSLSTDIGVELSDTSIEVFLNQIHLAVCGGTSVMVKSLANGKPVIYNKVLDPTQDIQPCLRSGILVINENKFPSINFVNDHYNSNDFISKYTSYSFYNEHSQKISSTQLINLFN